MIYFVQRGDTLNSIARRFNVSLQDVLLSNVICNPNFIYVGQLLIIPEENVKLPRAGGNPYYIVIPGDNLNCIAGQFSTTVKAMVEGNQIKNPNHIYPGEELLIAYDKPNPTEIFNTWKVTGDRYCGEMSSLQLHGIYYIGTFMWQSLASEALPYLEQLAKHSCEDVRFYTAISLGRIANGETVMSGLTQLLKDPDKDVANIAALALKRAKLVKNVGKRIHITSGTTNLLTKPIYSSPSSPLPEGTPIRVLRWGIPSPTGEVGPRGDIQIYDYIQVAATGQIGFLSRVGYNSIEII